jgi:hypothetical protein
MSYSKTSLGGDQIQGALSLSPRGKRIVYLVVGLVVAVIVAVAVWSGLSHDKYETSAKGCVNVTIASSTGGGTLNYCGAKAKAFCAAAFANTNRISLLARPQCDLAGLTRAKVSVGPGPTAPRG